MLGKVVGLVECAAAPVDDKLPLSYAIAYPVEAHVDGFGAALLHGIVGDAGGGAIVGYDGRGRLGMAHFFETGAEGASILTIVE